MTPDLSTLAAAADALGLALVPAEPTEEMRRAFIHAGRRETVNGSLRWNQPPAAVGIRAAIEAGRIKGEG